MLFTLRGERERERERHRERQRERERERQTDRQTERETETNINICQIYSKLTINIAVLCYLYC